MSVVVTARLEANAAPTLIFSLGQTIPSRWRNIRTSPLVSEGRKRSPSGWMSLGLRIEACCPMSANKALNHSSGWSCNSGSTHGLQLGDICSEQHTGPEKEYYVAGCREVEPSPSRVYQLRFLRGFSRRESCIADAHRLITMQLAVFRRLKLLF